MSGLLFIISAPSGSGKSTLVNGLRHYVDNLVFSVSYTTRRPRGSERNGCEYYFVEREEFLRMASHSEFLEHAEVFGNFYGSARRFFEEAAASGQDLLLDIDVQGERQVKEKIPGAVSIFILPPSRKELESRLTKRNRSENMDESIIQRRLLDATREIENYTNYDYIVINDRLEESLDSLVAIVLWERKKSSGEVLPNLDRTKPSAPHLETDCAVPNPISRKSSRPSGSGQTLLEEDRRMMALAESCRRVNMDERLRPILASFARQSTG